MNIEERIDLLFFFNSSNARKLQVCKQPFEIIQGQIAFKTTVQCVNKQTVVLLLHPVF